MFYDEKVDYKNYLPDIFQDIVEINALDSIINIQIDKLNTFVKDNINNKSVRFANEQGVARWEKILGVTSPLNSTLQARKDSLISKLMTKPPINILTLKGIIETYMGVSVDVTTKDFTIAVKYRGESKIADLNPMYSTIYQTIPANMILDIAYLFATYAEETSRFKTFSDEKGYTYKQIKRGEF